MEVFIIFSLCLIFFKLGERGLNGLISGNVRRRFSSLKYILNFTGLIKGFIILIILP